MTLRHLMRLELKKAGISLYLIVSLLGWGCAMLFSYIGLNDMTDHTYDTAFQMIGIVFNFYYIILYAVLVVVYVLNEYQNRTILVLFTYPVSRQKILLAKLCLITLTVFLALALGFCVCGGFLIIVSQHTQLIEGTFTTAVLASWAASALKATLLFCALGMCTFALALWRKSMILTLISSILLCYLRQFILAGTDAKSDSLLTVLLAIVLAGIGTFFALKRGSQQLEKK